ncbi:PIN domain-like protein [Clavulina sp. PMI_390]|nr:PIN domain-like protein [Clavulina sp. PMI_390]
MGIKGLTALLSEHAPKSITEHEMKTLFGRKVAVDASMSIYQFLIAVRQKDGEMLTNDAGETTSHLMGFFYRTIRMVEQGLKPMYVFDGKPPELKAGVLKERFAKRTEAKEDEEEAKEVGTVEEVDKLSRRQVKVTKEHNAECQKLLKLMGIPCIIAPSEAEAQCAELARGGKVYAAGSEDMDTLTFNAPILLRHLTFSEAKKMPISEIHLGKALEGLDMTMDQFIELCILLGCDYLEPIKGVGPKSALKLMKEYGNLGAVVDHLRSKMQQKAVEMERKEKKKKKAAKTVLDSEDEDDGGERDFESEDEVMAASQDLPAASSDIDGGLDDGRDDDDDDDADDEEVAERKRKVKEALEQAKKTKKEKAPATTTTTRRGAGGVHVPDVWLWEEAKKLFKTPDVTPASEIELVWTAPDVEGLVDFLVRDKGFSEERVRKGADKLIKMMNAKQQGRLDGFFTVQPKKDEKGKTAAGAPAKGKTSVGTKRKGGDKAGPSTTSKRAKK